MVLVGCAGSGDSETSVTTPPTAAAPADVTATTVATTSSTAVAGTAGAPTTETTTAATSTTVTPTTVAVPTAPTTTTTIVPPADPTLLPEPAGPLQEGSKGLRTRAVQQALRDQHYDPGDVDGAFGGKVTMAVWAFQSLHGMPKDGIVSPELETQILARPAQPMLKPELGPTHTEVDLTRQVMAIWRDGALSLITHVSSGSGVAYCEETVAGRNCGDATTPTGLYRYQRRIPGWRDAPLGRLYNPVYFNEGIAVHGASSVPDRPASHGCVRIPMSIAEYFPSLVHDGEQIEVFRS